MLIAAPIPRTSHIHQRLATMRKKRLLLYHLVEVHDGGIRLCLEGSSGSFRIAALQVVCSLALWWVVAGIGDGSRWAVAGQTSATLGIELATEAPMEPAQYS